jgi:hypothetical protein
LRQLYTLIIILFALAGAANCATVSYGTTSACGNCGGLPENLLVNITTGNGFITVQLDNMLADPTADTQAISGMLLILNFGTSAAPTLGSSTGSLIKILTKGAAATNDTTDTINAWEVSNTAHTVNTTTIDLDAFLASPPHDLVIGPAGANGKYNNVNNSITNVNHNPYINQIGTFTINLVGVTTSTTVTAATFNVGTAKGLCIGGTVDQCIGGGVLTPEPATFNLLWLAAVLYGVYLRQRRKSRRA